MANVFAIATHSLEMKTIFEESVGWSTDICMCLFGYTVIIKWVICNGIQFFTLQKTPGNNLYVWKINWNALW